MSLVSIEKLQDAAAAARQARKDAGLKTTRTPYERATADPRSRQKAISAMCWQCQGEDADPNVRKRIDECKITGCALYGFRPRVKIDSAAPGPGELSEI